MLDNKNLELLKGFQQKNAPETILDRDYLAYDFIDIKPDKRTYSNTKRGNLTGVLTVELETVTPLVAVEEMKGVKANITKIPASSLRGMIRTVAEILWEETVTVMQERNKLAPEEIEVIPEEWYLSNDTTLGHHRLASHLFGFVVNDGRKSTESTAMASVLKFSDAINDKAEAYSVYIKQHVLSKPQGIKNTDKKVNALNPAYLHKNQKRAAGRKIYLAGRIKKLEEKCVAAKPLKMPNSLTEFVGPNKNYKKKPKDIEVDLILPNTKFKFTIQFNQLERQQLSALIRVLELTDHATHALGRGKPLGFGRVKLTVTSINVQQKESFFDLSQSAASKILNKKDLLSEIDPYIDKLRIFETYATISNFDNKKAYLPKGNAKLNNHNKRKVIQYSKHKG